jgi:membrane protein implicated in regulation of membrane protease activity
MDEISSLLYSWSQRARLQRSLALAFFGLACGLGVALIVGLASRVFPLLETSALVALALACSVIGVVAALAYPWIRNLRTRPIQWARAFDRRFDLQERLSTALEIGAGDLTVRNDTLRIVQRNDAQRSAESVDVKKLLPLRFSRRDALVCLVFAIALILALALPNPQQQALAEREQLRQTMEQQIQQLEQMKQAIQQSSLSDEQKQQALQAIDEAQQVLRDPNTTPEEALAAINDMQSSLDALVDQAAQEQAQDLQRAGESLTPDELTNALANSLANNDFDRAAQQMRNLTSKDGQPLSDDEIQRVANQLDELARNVQNSDQQLAERLREAAQRMREGNADAAQQSLDQAAQSLDQASESAQATQSLDAAQSMAESARQAIAQASPSSANASEANQGQFGQLGSESAAAASQQSPGGQPGEASQSQGAASNLQNAQSGPSDQSGESRHSEDTGSDSSVYAPRRIGGEGKSIVLPDPKSQAAPNPSGKANTAPGGDNTVPYQEVYADYSKVADEALQTGEVPPEMRDYVRDYFSSLDPNQGR